MDQKYLYWKDEYFVHVGEELIIVGVFKFSINCLYIITLAKFGILFDAKQITFWEKYCSIIKLRNVVCPYTKEIRS